MYLKCDSVKKAEPFQLYIDTEIELPEGAEVISVPVKAWAEAPLSKTNEVVTTLNIEYSVVIATENGIEVLKEHRSEGVRIPFPGLSEGAFSVVKAVIVGSEYAGDGVLKVRVMAEVNASAIFEEGFEAAENTGLEVRTEKITVYSALPISVQEIVYSVAAAPDADISSVIASQSIVTIDSVSVATDLLHVSGCITTYIQYLKDGKINGTTVTKTFEEEVLASGMTEGGVAEVIPSLAGEVASSEDGSIRVEGVLRLTGFCFVPECFSVISDAYSLTKELSLQFKEAQITENVCLVTDKSKFFGSVREESFAPYCIAALNAPGISAMNVKGMNPVNIEGVLTAHMTAEDSSGVPRGVQAEIAFRTECYPSEECPGSVSVSAEIADYSARLRQGGTIELSGEIAVRLLSESTRFVRYLASYEELGDKELPENPVITLYIAGREETLFDVAKALNADTERLKELNPGLGELSEGDKIIYYDV